MSLIRETVLLPPDNWRPRPLTKAEKKYILTRQDNKDAVTGVELPPLGKGLVHFDHRPPVHEREWDPIAQDTIPPANDLAKIFAILAAGEKGHRAETGRDNKRMSKTDRLRIGQDAINAAMARHCGQKRQKKNTIPARKDPWPKGRKLQSRGFDKKPKRHEAERGAP